jgi:hypothetical protein
MVQKRLNNPKQYTEAEFALKRAEAKALFLAGKNPEDIDTILELRNGRSIQWAAKYGWLKERDKVMEVTTQTRLQKILKEQDKMFEEIGTIKEKAYDSIFTDEVRPQKFSEASSAYLNAVEMERKLKTEALQLSFITDVAKVLREKIQDKDLLFKIAEGLKEVFDRYQTKSLPYSDSSGGSDG